MFQSSILSPESKSSISTVPLPPPKLLYRITPTTTITKLFTAIPLAPDFIYHIHYHFTFYVNNDQYQHPPRSSADPEQHPSASRSSTNQPNRWGCWCSCCCWYPGCSQKPNDGTILESDPKRGIRGCHCKEFKFVEPMKGSGYFLTRTLLCPDSSPRVRQF